jgi:xylulose-5-phosphate/fructose-6-phosphate phosphoketolase
MDNPDVIAACVVGDGEAETGPTAAYVASLQFSCFNDTDKSFRAWHATKFLDPKESGAVLPILHVNGFKISERTIFGCMDNKELVSLFSGYGYQVCIVDELDDINNQLASALEWALYEIKVIQYAARTKRALVKPRWPMIILRTPKV